MNCFNIGLAVLGFTILMPAAAGAAFVLDQSNTRIDVAPTIPTSAIGGSSSQKLAQTFAVGRTGPLAKLRLPLACTSGTLLVEIVEQAADGMPTGAVLSSTSIAAASIRTILPTPPDFIDVNLGSPLPVTAGDKLAIVLSNATGECGVARAEPGETYAGGRAYFISLPETPDWVTLDLDGVLTPDPADLLFETYIEVPGGGGTGSLCGVITLPGGSGPPANSPICRCLSDPGLREFRCALLDPDFFAIRRIPWPIPLDKPYIERWQVLPLTQFDGPVRVDLAGANIPDAAKFSFSGKDLKALETRSVTLKAPAKPMTMPAAALISYGDRAYRLDTTIPAEAFRSDVKGFGAKDSLKDVKDLKDRKKGQP